jgi:hypothetical protein
MLMKLMYKIASLLLILSGLLQIAFTPVFFSHFGLDVLWFAGSGLGFVFLGNLNLIVLLSQKLNYYTMILSSNVLGLMFTIIVLTILNSIQAYIALVIMLLVVIGSIYQYFRLVRKTVYQNFTVRY